MLYQGDGHYQGTACGRDAVKKTALVKAGVRYFEVTPEDGPRDIARVISRLVPPVEPAEVPALPTDAPEVD